MNVGQNYETVVDKYLRRLVGADRVGQEPLGIGNDLQLYPVRACQFTRELGHEHCLICGAACCGVGEDRVLVPVEVVEDALLVGIVQIETPDRDGDDLRPRSLYGLDHLIHRAMASGPNHESCTKLLTCYDKRVIHGNSSRKQKGRATSCRRPRLGFIPSIQVPSLALPRSGIGGR